MVNIMNIYPDDLQRIFVDRVKFLSLMEQMKVSLKTGTRENLALLGSRRIGKSLILKEFIKQNNDKEVIIAYIDLERMDMVPELFAREYIGTIVAWYLGEGIVEDYYDLDFVLSGIRELKEPYDLVFSIKQEMLKAKYNYANVLRKAFQFPGILAKAADRKIIVIFDEFQDIKELNNYRLDILKIFRSIMQTQSGVLYMFSGSAVSFMERIFKESTSPLYLQSRIEYVDYLTREDSIELSRKILRADWNPYRVYELTAGHPYYIYSVCKRIESMDLSDEKIVEAFVIEALTPAGRIYNLCQYVMENSIHRARGFSLLKSVLKIVAKEEGLRIGDVSRRINRSAGVTRNLIDRLKDVDLIDEKNGDLFIADPVLRYWMVHYYFGEELTASTVQKSLTRLMNEFEEKYLRASTELGKAKEYELKVKLEKELGLGLDNYNKDGIEFDLVGEKNGVLHVVEIKWRNKATGYGDVANFTDKVRQLSVENVKTYFISKSGFTKKARDLMETSKVTDLSGVV